jgi:hypothetical protein
MTSFLLSCCRYDRLLATKKTPIAALWQACLGERKPPVEAVKWVVNLFELSQLGKAAAVDNLERLIAVCKVYVTGKLTIRSTGIT